MLQPSLEEVREIAAKGGYRVCPVKREILSDFTTPVETMRRLLSASKHCFLLESADSSKTRGRYTFLGYGPKDDLIVRDGVLTCGGKSVETEDPNSYIRKVLAEHRSPRLPGFPPFTGGLVGYFSFDYIGYSEPVLRRKGRADDEFNDVDLMLFDRVIAFDSSTQRIVLIANVDLGDVDADYRRAEIQIDAMEDLIRNSDPSPGLKGRMTSEIRPLFSEDRYCLMVAEAKKRIKEGECFQIVLSNRLDADYEGSLFDTYRVLRSENPSPYMFYFSGTDVELAGASPETLVKVEDGTVTASPLAGTRPRGRTEEEDRELEEGLLKDPKELAEHDMLIDLERNDIGKVCDFGTVRVTEMHKILRYSHVMHIASTVKGRLAEGKDALDAMASILPAGTLSGAPKIRACQIIEELEGGGRGIYGGSVGYIDFAGNMDACISIRLAYKKGGKVYVRSGAGIVADSVPENEHRECLNKAKAVVVALKEAEGRL